MGSWRKLLDEMVASPKPNNYRYDDAVRILERLGFTLAGGSSGSHRLWKRPMPGGTVARIGLVDSGSGPMRSVYIRKLCQTLRDEGLYPLQERDDDVDRRDED